MKQTKGYTMLKPYKKIDNGIYESKAYEYYTGDITVRIERQTDGRWQIGMKDPAVKGTYLSGLGGLGSAWHGALIYEENNKIVFGAKTLRQAKMYAHHEVKHYYEKYVVPAYTKTKATR